MGIVDRSLKLGNRERIIRTCRGEDVDRLPFFLMQGTWPETLQRWRDEGMESDDLSEVFGFDAGFDYIPVNLGYYPMFEQKVISDDGKMRVRRNEYGITLEEKVGHSTIPNFIDYPVKTREDWETLKKERLDPNSPERFPDNWQEVARSLKEKDAALQIGTWPYGLFGTPRDLFGVEGLLMAFCEEPELIHDIIDYLTDFWIEIYKLILKDVQIDHIHIWEDMSCKHGPLISPAMIREFMMPNYKKIVEFAKQNGISIVSIDTDGNVDLLLPIYEECGINLVLPFEVQAGSDVVKYRKDYPNISILGGIDKRELAYGYTEIDAELDRISELFTASGYIPSPDHQVHPEVSYENFMYYTRQLLKRLQDAAT